MKFKLVGTVVDCHNKTVEVELDEDDIKLLIRQKAEDNGVKMYNGYDWMCAIPKIKEYYFHEG